MHRFIALLLICISVTISTASLQAQETNRTGITVFWGRGNDGEFIDAVLLKFGPWRPYYIGGVGINRELFNINQSNGPGLFSLEWGNRLVVHRDPHVSYGEVDTFILGRYHYFPWSRYVLTTIAFGQGVSYASKPLTMEEEADQVKRRFLNYMLFELTLGMPSVPDVQLAIGIHHRSGFYGLLGVNGGSNFPFVGITKWF